MLSQISVVGRTSGRAAARNQVARTFHSDVAAAAKASKAESGEKSGPALITATFAELLEDQIAQYPHKDTFESSVEDLKWTTQQLYWHVTGVTGSLHEPPCKGQSSYTSQAALRPEMLVGLLAAPKAGKHFALIPPFQPDHMIEQLYKSDAQFLLFFPKIGKTVQLDEIYNVFPDIVGLDVRTMGIVGDPRLPKLQTIVHTAKRLVPGMVHHVDFQVPHYPKEFLRRGRGPIGADEVSTLIWENGEYAALSQSNLLNTANALGETIGIGADSGAVLTAVSPIHASGVTAGLLMPLVRRAKLVTPGDVPYEDTARIHDSIAKHGVSHVLADSTTWSALLKSSQPAQVKAFAEKIKSATVVGDAAAVNPQLVSAIGSTFGIPSERLHTTQGDAASSGIALVDGKPLAGTQTKIINGHLAVKGPNTFKGIFANGRLDSTSISKDGFAHTTLKVLQD